MKISGKRLNKIVEKEHGDTLELLKNTRSFNIKKVIKKQLNTRIKNYLNSILKDKDNGE